MKTSHVLLVAALAGCATDLETTSAELATGFVHRSGGALAGNDGAPLVLTGANLGGWLLWEGWIMGGQLGSGNSETKVYAGLVDLLGADAAAAFREHQRDAYITEADIARVAALGFNSVRVPFNHSLIETDEHPFQYSAAGLARLDAVVAWGERHHVYVVLDLHAAPAGQCNEFPDDPEPTLMWDRPIARWRTIALWKAIAARYKDRRWVAGYDLLNEPCGGTAAELRTLYAQIIAAIREVDPNHLVIVEGNTAATDFTGFDQLLDPNQAYSFHTYNFLGDNRAARFPVYARLAASQQAPLWVGEFGEASEAYLRSTVDMFHDPQYRVTAGYALWTWKRGATGNPTLQTVAIPPLWARTMKWITAPLFNPRPSAAEAAAGAAQYLEAIALDRCREDAALAADLQ